MQGLLKLKGVKIKKKRSKKIFVHKNLKIRIVIMNVIWSKDTLVYKAERPSNYFSTTFTHTQAEQIKKGVTCVQLLLEIHLA